MTNRKNLLAVKTLIENGSRATLGQVVVEDRKDRLVVIPAGSTIFGATELCNLINHPLSGFFAIEDNKVVLHIF
jgi:hypothetical protein